MEKFFVILGKDIAGNFTGVLAKRSFESRDEAEEHAKTVLQSQGTQNNLFYVMESASVVQRTSPPIEVLQYHSSTYGRKAA